MLLITVAAAVTVYLLRYILRGQIGDRIVRFLVNAYSAPMGRRAPGMPPGGEDLARTIYQLVIRNNMDMILFVAILIFLVIFFRFSVSWFTKYFDEISAGMEKLEINKDLKNG